MSENDDAIVFPSMGLVDISQKEKPNPCPDCGRRYKVKESVTVMIQDRPDPVWDGCIDCWLKRTSPEMCKTFAEEDKMHDVGQ